MAHYQRLRDLREDADKTQQEIADYLGTSAQHYGKYESGKAEIPLERAVMLAKYYNVSLDYIAGISSSRHPLTSDSSFSPIGILSDKITRLSDNEKQAVKDTLSSVIDDQIKIPPQRKCSAAVILHTIYYICKNKKQFYISY